MKYCMLCEKSYPESMKVCPVHNLKLTEKEENVLTYSSDTITEDLTDVLKGAVHEDDVQYLFGLEKDRTNRRITFTSQAPGKVAALILWALGFMLLICLAIIYFAVGIKVKDALGILGAVAFFAAIGYVLRITIKHFYIIDFEEGIFVKSTSLIQGALRTAVGRRPVVYSFRKHELCGVSISYRVEGKLLTWARKIESFSDCITTEDELMPNTKLATAVVLLTRGGGTVPITDYNRGKIQKSRGDSTAKIISKLWNLPYYECPPASTPQSPVFKGNECLWKFRRLTFGEHISRTIKYDNNETIISWVLFAIFLLVIFPLFVYYLGS